CRIDLHQVFDDGRSVETAKLANRNEPNRLGAGLRDIDHGIAGFGTIRLREHQKSAAPFFRVRAFKRDRFQDRDDLLRIGGHESSERLNAEVHIREISLRNPCRWWRNRERRKRFRGRRGWNFRDNPRWPLRRGGRRRWL